MRGFTYETRGSAGGLATDWQTPPEVFAALGLTFDLDPAAPAGGGRHVPARRYHALAEGRDGLRLPWRGRVWLNPPYGGRVIVPWVERLVAHGDGLLLSFARTDARWFHVALRASRLAGLAVGRWGFLRPDGSRPGRAGCGAALFAYGAVCAGALRRAAPRLNLTLIKADPGVKG